MNAGLKTMGLMVAGAVASLLAPSAVAQVAVEATATQNTSGGNAASFLFSNFSLGAGNALAVIVNSEAGGGSGTPAFSVSYAGTALTNSIFTNQGSQAAGIFWVINPTATSGDINVSLGTSSNAAVTVLSLGNVGGVGDTATGVSTSNAVMNLTYDAAANGLIVVGGVDNTFNNSPAPVLGGANFSTYTQQLPNNFQTGVSSSGISQGYGAIGSDGTGVVTTFDPANTTSSTRNAAALVAFTAGAAVPEPASLALLAAGGAMMLVRRRRGR